MSSKSTPGGNMPDELALLRQRVADLEQQLAAYQQAERAVGDLEIFKAVVDNAPDAVGLSGLDGLMFYANAALHRILGYGDEVLGVNFYRLYPEEYHPTIDAAGQEVIERGFWQGPLHWKHKEGHLIPVQVTVFLIRIVDTQVANALLHAAQAVRLLGARVALSGIRPEVAQTLVGLDLDLSGIVTHSTLQI